MRIRVLVLLSLLPLVALAQPSLQVIDLRYRSAQELLPLLQPVVEPGGSISAYNSQLIVRATPAQMTELRQLLDQLDRAPRQLMISVRQGGVVESRGLGVGVSGVYRRGDGSIVVPRADGSLPRGGVELELGQREQRDDRGISQQLRVEEGREAQIMLGSSQPYSYRERLPDGTVVTRTEYRDAGSGFTVLPRLQGERVQLEISAQQQRFTRGGAIDTRSASSVVGGPLGEWFEIGAAVQQASASSGGLSGYSEGSSRSDSSIQVRVELLP